MSKIPELSSKYLILNSAGLNIVGRVAAELFKNEADKNKISSIINKLAQIDWKKTAPIWSGNILTDGARGAKISTSNSSIKKAFEKVSNEIGLKEGYQEIKEGLFGPLK